MAGWDADRLVAEVQRLGRRGLPRDDYFRELGVRLRRTMPVDASCWHVMDPHTLLLTTVNPIELYEHGFLTAETEPRAARAFFASEYELDDYNTFATLVRRRTPVGILSEATRGRPERSARYRECLTVLGTPFELRAAMVRRGRASGCVVLHRTERTGDFQPADARVMARLSKPIAEGIRTSLLRDAANRPEESHAPGMILLGRGNEVEFITPPAQRLLEPLRRASAGATATLPAPVIALAAAARSHAAVDTAPETAALHVLTGEGGLTLHASLPDGGRSHRVAIVIQPASAARTAALRLEAYGVTDREREVATLVACGLTTEALAARLFVSPWTVQDHLKSIFEKTGTHSRRELRALVFFDELLPAITARAPVGADGALVTPGSAT